MKIAIISGSVRQGRQSHQVAIYLQHLLRQRLAEVTLIDLREEQLTVFGEEQRSNLVEKRVTSISRKLHEADAIILVTPEYHASFSGALKNALDYFGSEFKRKPVSVAAASSGRLGGINASSQLQQVVLGMGAIPLPVKFLVPEIDAAFDQDHIPQSRHTERNANRFIDEFLWFTEAVEMKKNQEKQLIPTQQ